MKACPKTGALLRFQTPPPKKQGYPSWAQKSCVLSTVWPRSCCYHPEKHYKNTKSGPEMVETIQCHSWLWPWGKQTNPCFCVSISSNQTTSLDWPVNPTRFIGRHFSPWHVQQPSAGRCWCWNVMKTSPRFQGFLFPHFSWVISIYFRLD